MRAGAKPSRASSSWLRVQKSRKLPSLNTVAPTWRITSARPPSTSQRPCRAIPRERSSSANCGLRIGRIGSEQSTESSCVDFFRRHQRPLAERRRSGLDQPNVKSYASTPGDILSVRVPLLKVELENKV